jgi:hypothetical protein
VNPVAATAPIMTRSLVLRVVLAWLLVCVMTMIAAWSAIPQLRFNDPDDALRLVQVRGLIAGQSWFDLTLHGVDAPRGVLMHWSRLVDVPIALVILLLRPLVGAAGAEQAAIVIVPALTLLCGMLLTGRLARQFGSDSAALVASLLWPLSFATMTQFAPLRIDHHGWQIVALLAAANALFARRARPGGWLIGASLATGMAISLELLPYAGLFAAVLALRWLANREARGGLVAMLDGLALTSLALFALTRGTDLTPWCDIASPGYLAGFVLAAVLVRLIALRPLAPVVVAGLLGISALLCVGLFLAVAPQCTRGPFAALDPLVYEYWYKNVLEGLPVWRQPLANAAQMAVPPLFGLIAAAFLWRSSESDGQRRNWREFALLLGGFFLIAVVVARAGAAACALATVPTACALRPLLARVQDMRRPVLRVLALAGVLLALIPGMAVVAAQKAAPVFGAKSAAPVSTASLQQVCGMPGSVAVLDSLPRSTLFTPLDIGPWVLLRSHHGVVATGHHRASAPMRDVISAFLAQPDEAHALIRKHGAGYVLTCSDLTEAGVYRDMSGTGLMARLLAGKPPGWLQPVPLPGDAGTLRVWKVVG